MSWGFVFVCGNDAMRGIYKVGSCDIAPMERAAQFSNSNAVPAPYKLLAFIQVNNAALVERDVLLELSDHAFGPHRGFLATNVEQIVGAFRRYAVDVHATSALEQFIEPENDVAPPIGDGCSAK
jgi:hypothetical protein